MPSWETSERISSIIPRGMQKSDSCYPEVLCPCHWTSHYKVREQLTLSIHSQSVGRKSKMSLHYHSKQSSTPGRSRWGHTLYIAKLRPLKSKYMHTVTRRLKMIKQEGKVLSPPVRFQSPLTAYDMVVSEEVAVTQWLCSYSNSEAKHAHGFSEGDVNKLTSSQKVYHIQLCTLCQTQ